VQNIAWGLSQAPVGAIADKWGLRPAMLAGGVLHIIGMLVMLMAAERPPWRCRVGWSASHCPAPRPRLR
jgi:hypothetical protein